MKTAQDTGIGGRFAAPTGGGAWPPGTCGVTVGRAAEIRHGAMLEVHLQVQADGRCRARFLAVGPPELIAAGSWLADWVEGREAAELSAFTPGLVEQGLELPAEAVFCGVLCRRALLQALGPGTPGACVDTTGSATL